MNKNTIGVRKEAVVVQPLAAEEGQETGITIAVGGVKESTAAVEVETENVAVKGGGQAEVAVVTEDGAEVVIGEEVEAMREETDTGAGTESVGAPVEVVAGVGVPKEGR